MHHSVRILTAAMALAISCWSSPGAAQSVVEQTIALSCGGCHAPTGEGRWTRISEQRKTPEGWQMTLVRMQLVHKAQLVDPEGSDSGTVMRALVRHFADTQGLAPAESRPYRYILEQELNTVEDHPSEEFRQMCARCHTGARVALQRRTQEEWANLVHFHLGQYPTTEYQMMGRDRDWFRLALEEMVPYLAEHFPLETAAWDDWSATAPLDFEGRWRLLGSMPGKGDFQGTMIATRQPGADYKLALTGTFSDGEALAGSGSAIVYTGHEWRASLTIGERSFRQVMASAEDGSSLLGRMFDRDRSEWGLRLRAVRDTGEAQLLAVQPSYLQAGAEGRLRLLGSNLAGPVNLGDGLRVLEELARSADAIELRVAARDSAATGLRAVAVGAAELEQGLTVFDTIGRVEVEPAFAVARVGGNGGSQPLVEALFDAVAWSHGGDGKPRTADDLRLGPIAASWSLAPWDEQARADQDLRFAGTLDKDRGVFTPAGAGPNPERKYGTNNAGNLRVLATVKQGETTLQGDGHLIVTVQRWNNPPIR